MYKFKKIIKNGIERIAVYLNNELYMLLTIEEASEFMHLVEGE